MADIASLGISVDVGNLPASIEMLTNLAAAAERVERTITRLGAACREHGSGVSIEIVGSIAKITFEPPQP